MTQQKTADEELRKFDKNHKKVITYSDLLRFQIDEFFSKDAFWYTLSWT